MNPQGPGYPQPPTNPAYPDPNQPGTASKDDNPLSVMQPGEQVVCEIKRHPIGLLGPYVGSGLLLVIVGVVVFGVAPNFITSVSSSQVVTIGGLLFFVVALAAFGFVWVANKVYYGNKWVVTSDSITQVSQSSLFDKQSSQLSLGNLEDVTVEQDGVFQHMYNFGLLRCETAGSRSKFVFMFCPNPNFYAKKILEAREQFEQAREGGNQQRLYRQEGAYQQQPPPGQYYGQPGQPVPPPPGPGQNPPYQQPQQPQTNPMPPYYGGNNDSGVNINSE